MRAWLALTMLSLAGCGGDAPRAGELTQDEEQQLNDAAAMLDEPEGEGAQGKTREPADE